MAIVRGKKSQRGQVGLKLMRRYNDPFPGGGARAADLKARHGCGVFDEDAQALCLRLGELARLHSGGPLGIAVCQKQQRRPGFGVLYGREGCVVTRIGRLP